MALQIVPASTDYGDAYIPPDITLDITESDGLEFEGESNLYDSSDNLIRQDKFKGESSLQYTVPLVDVWSDLKDGGYTVDVNVSAEVPVPPTPIANIPSQSGTLTYNGSFQIPSFANYNSEQLQINGTDTAVDAGTYTVTFTPKEGYCWADGSVGAVSVQWKINKANNPMTLSDYTYSIEEKKQYVFTIAIYNKQGNVTYTNKDGVTVNLTGNTLKFTVNGSLLTKNIVIPITDEGTNNYLPITQNFTIINNIPDETLGLHLLSVASYPWNNGNNHYVWNRTNYSSISSLPYKVLASGAAVLFNNEIHILGGQNDQYSGDNQASRKHYRYDGDKWVSASTLPYDFTRGCAVVYHDEIHILGGQKYSDPNVDERINHYKWNGSTWTKLDDLPTHCYQSIVIVYHDAIHFLCGKRGNYWDAHYKYQDNAWTKLNHIASEPKGLSWGDCTTYRACVYRDELYIDTSAHNYPGYLYKYNEETDSFIKDVSSQDAGSLIVFDNKIHKLGTQYYPTRHFVLNGTTWQRLEDIPYSFGGCHVLVAKNPKRNEPITTLPSQNNLLIFNGQTQSPTWRNFDETKMTIGGTTSSVNAGTFEATFTPKNGYCWSDESTTSKTITWTINKASFEIDKTVVNMDIGETTSVTMKNFPIYDHYPDVSFNATDVSQHLGVVIEWANIKETDPTQCTIKIKVHDSGSTYGQKQITFTSSGNNNYVADTQTVDVFVAQSSQPRVISKIPVQTGLYTVSGKTQAPVWDVEDANIATVAANTAGTNTGGLRIMNGTSATSNAGTYTIYWKPQDGYSWWDGSTTSKTSTWTITSAQTL